jgi:hypothetical protein
MVTIYTGLVQSPPPAVGYGAQPRNFATALAIYAARSVSNCRNAATRIGLSR